MGAASIVPPHSSFREHLKHRIWKFPLERQEPEAGPIAVDVGMITHSLGRAKWTRSELTYDRAKLAAALLDRYL